MDRLLLYSGVKTIGGNRFLLESGGKRIFLDYGINPDDLDQYYDSPFGKPSHKDILYEMLRMGVLEYVPGMFRRDLARYSKLTIHEKPLVDYVVNTHCHLDHIQGDVFVDERIPLVFNEETLQLFEALEETNQSGILNRFTQFNEILPDADENELKRVMLEHKITRFERKVGDYKFTYIPRPDLVGPKTAREMLVADNLETDGVKIKLVKVDHLHGAAGLLIETNETRLFYSGDIRIHGPKKELTEITLEEVSGFDVHYALIEGTRIDEEEKVTEAQMRERAIEKINLFSEENRNKHVFAQFTYKDTDRMEEFKTVAAETGRSLVVPPKVYYYYRTLEKYIPYLTKGLLVYRRKRGTAVDIAFGTKTWRNVKFKKAKVVSDQEMNENPDRYLIMLSPDQKNKLLDFFPDKGSLVIYTATPPWDDASRLSEGRMASYMENLGLLVYWIHVSHHAPQQDTKYFVEKTHPKNLVVIHSVGHEIFQKLFGSMTNVISVQKGSMIDLASGRISAIPTLEITRPKYEVFADTVSPILSYRTRVRPRKKKSKFDTANDVHDLRKYFRKRRIENVKNPSQS